MNPGELDHKLTLYSVAETDDSYGGSSFAETEIETLWAKRQDLRSREQFDNAHTERSTMVRFQTWYREAITQGKRLKDSDGNTWDILSVDPKGGRSEMVILAELRS